MHGQLGGIAILQPVVALIAWTLVMWLWMYATRIPAMRRAGIDVGKLTGGTGADLRQRIDAKSQWPADNYNHLLEQPVLFYAICLTLAMIQQGGGVNAMIAWIYVALRVAHSLVQVTTNRVIVRFALFTLSTLALVALTLHAAMSLFR